MKKLMLTAIAAGLCLGMAGTAVAQDCPESAPVAESVERPVVELALDTGTVEIELRRDLAPLHVARMLTLASECFYDGIVFHRVIEGFMAQTGDPTGTGMGGSELPDLPAEFSDENFARGVLGMARSQDVNSGNSQFFIMYADAPHLNNQYTAFGTVVSGMDLVDGLKNGPPSANGMVDGPDKIVTLRVKPGQ